MPGSIIALLLTLAKKDNNYVATAAAFSDSTTLHKATVPAGKRWFLIAGYVKRDAAATLIITLRDSAGANIGKILDEAAGTTGVAYPEADFQVGTAYILDEAEWIQFDFGVAQGAGAYLSCMVLEVDI